MRSRLAGAFVLGVCAAAASAAGAQTFDALVLKGTRITYWYQHSQIREAALQKMIARFNATNPWGIVVQGEYAGNYSEIANKMTASIAGGKTPDLVVAYQSNASTYEQSDALVDLNPYVADRKYGYSAKELADFFPGFLSQDIHGEFGGKRLGWPPNRSAEVLYYNADWLKALGFSGPPRTWEEFREAAKRATDPAKGTVGYEISVDASSVFAQVVSRGGDFRSPSGAGYALDTPQLREAFAFMAQLYKDGYARKIGGAYGDQTDFMNRKTLFVITATSGMPFFAAGVEKGAKGPFAWSVAPLPHSTPKPVLNIYGASVSVVKSAPERQLASWLFLRWMTEPEQQAEWTRVSNYFPVRKSTAECLGDYLAANPRFAAAWSALKESDQKAEPPFSGYDEVRDAISAAFNAVLDGADIAAATAGLDVKAKRIYQRYKP